MAMLLTQRVLPREPALGRMATPALFWALLATAALCASTLLGPGPSLAEWLGDTDDALRLVSVRDLLAGAPWYDTTLSRVGAPAPLVSHWSRLVDAPLALLIGGFSPLIGREGAELAARIVWPLLTFLLLAYLVAREAERQGGRLAAAFAMFLLTTSAIALAQFRPGRIDHHNVQILCAVAGLLVLARSVKEPRYGWNAGALLGLGLAVGYEAMALLVPTLGLAALAAICRPQLGAGITRAGAAAAAALVAALIATQPPLGWFEARCDALSLNLVLLAAYAAGGLWAACVCGARLPARLAVLACAVGCGFILYAGIEPACLAGPFGQVGDALRPLWLDHVIETKSLLWLGRSHPGTALGLFGFLLAGVAAQIALWRRRPDATTTFATAVVATAAALGCWQVKLLPYAAWLAVLPLSVWAATLSGTRLLSAPAIRFAAVVLLSQSTLDAGFSALTAAFRQQADTAPSAVEAADPRQPCYQSPSVRQLAALAPGLVAADLDLGPYIVALTPHRVLAAPYHRIERSILANHAILAGTPEAALTRLRALGVGYIALCDSRAPASGSTPETLRTRLLAGRPPDGLAEVALDPETAVRAWRVR
jgi:hypothetical protein